MINIYTYDSGSPLPGVDAPTANKINGVMTDDGIPGDGQGMPVDKRTYRDMYYANIAVMNAAGIAADNTEEGATQSQFLDAVLLFAQLGSYIVYDQTTFNALFTRTSTNVYDINASVTSVVFKPGNYLVSGILSGGDTWADIQTNNCITLKAENGTTIDFEDLRGKFLVDTEDCLVEHVHVTGDGTTVASLDENIEVSAGGVTLRNCKVSNRVSSEATGTNGFFHSGNYLQKITSDFENCIVTACSNTVADFVSFNSIRNVKSCVSHGISTVGNAIGFKGCSHLTNCHSYDLTSSSGESYGFYTCERISSSKSYEISTTGAGAAYGFYTCSFMNSCDADKIDTTGAGAAIGFNTCNGVSSCRAVDIDTTNADAYGFFNSSQISSSYVADIQNSGASAAYGFNLCLEVSACKAYDIATSGAGTAYGFSTCERLSGCYADAIDNTSTGAAIGFSTCNEISGCKAENIDTTSGNVYGFNDCNQVSGCTAEDIDSTSGIVYGFNTCLQVSSCKAIDLQSASSATVYGFISCDHISSCIVDTIDNTSSGSATGFQSCDEVSGCEANSIRTTGAGLAVGFATCENISGCKNDVIDAGGAGNATGFQSCSQISSCDSVNVASASGIARGYSSCLNGSSLKTNESINNNNDWMDSSDAQITNQNSMNVQFT